MLTKALPKADHTPDVIAIMTTEGFTEFPKAANDVFEILSDNSEETDTPIDVLPLPEVSVLKDELNNSKIEAWDVRRMAQSAQQRIDVRNSQN